jgi:centrosomal protein CEP44
MSLGDLHNNREKLRAELRALKYSEPIDVKGLNDGEPSSTLPIIHFCMLSYSKVFAEFIVDQGFDMMSKNDFSFLESVFKVLRQKLNYRPVLKIGQFLASGFAERKIMMLLDLINIVKTKTNELQRYQQAEERKSRSPFRSVEEENIKIQTPPRPSNKVYKDPEEILIDYSDVLKKKVMEKEESQDVLKILNNILEDQRKMQAKIADLEEIIRKMQKKHEADTAQAEARIHLLSSKVKVLEGEKKEVRVERKGKKEEKGQEGLLSKLGISSNHLAFGGFCDPNSDFLENY